MTLSEKEVRSPAPGGLEYAARYTHHYMDGRQVAVTNYHHANPADRAWAADQVAEMTRVQTACEWPVDAQLMIRRTTTEWVPEHPSEAQRDGLACIICGAEDTESIAMAPAGFADGRQLFRCAAACDPGAEWLNKEQRNGLACVLCGILLEGKSMERAGELAGGAVWRCFPVCPVPVAAVPDALVEVVLQQRGLAGLFADIGKIRAELAEILTKAKALGL